jgi:hypothetical protein
VRVADEAQHPEVAKDFKDALPHAGLDHFSFNLSFLLDVHRFIQYRCGDL